MTACESGLSRGGWRHEATRGRWAVASLAALLVLAAAAGAAVTRDLDAPYEPYVNAAGLTIEVQWAETWEATARQTRADWPDADNPVAERTRSVREIELLSALIDRFDDPPDRIHQARMAIAQHYEDLGMPFWRDRTLKQIIDDRDAAAEHRLSAMRELVGERLHGMRGRDRLDFAMPWIRQWAQSQAIELDPDFVTRVVDEQFEMLISRGEMAEAWHLTRWLQKYRSLDDSDAWVRRRDAMMVTRAGLLDLAEQRWRQIAELAPGTSAAREAAEQLGELAKKRRTGEPRFPTDPGLDRRWTQLRADMSEAMLQALARDASVSEALYQPSAEAVHRSLWFTMAESRRSHRAEMNAPRAEDPPQVPDNVDLLATFRTHPFSEAVHRRMLARAEQRLREGRVGRALVWAEDVIRYAELDAFRHRGRGIAALALSQLGDPAAAHEHLQQMDDATLGESGGDVMRRLRKRLTDASGRQQGRSNETRLVTMDWLRLPPAAPWPVRVLERAEPEFLRHLAACEPALQQHGERFFAVAPGMIACYDPGASQPAWSRSQIVGRSVREGEVPDYVRNPIVAPGRFVAAFDEQHMYVRWGLDDAQAQMTQLVALDLDTGVMQWTTADHPALAPLIPMGDPAADDGYVYFLARSAGLLPRLFVVCVDANTGEPRWRRQLVSQQLMIEFRHRREKANVDLVQFGSGVTVHRGAVYAMTNVGVLARLDPRDGLVRWAHRYERIAPDPHHATILPRLGGGPVVVGDVVVFAPRDHPGIIAVDVRTGRQAWMQPVAASDQLIGTHGRHVVFADDTRLIALRIETGEVAWTFEPETPPLGATIDSAGRIHLSVRSGQVVLDASTGQVVGREDGRGAGAIALAGEDDRRVGLTNTTEGISDSPRGSRSEADACPVDGLMLHPSWEMAAVQPEVSFEPSGTSAGRAAMVRTGTLWRYIEPDADRVVQWRLLTRPDVRAVGWSEDLVLLGGPGRLTAFDRRTGQMRWRTSLPFSWNQDGLAIRTHGDRVVVWPRNGPFQPAPVAVLDQRTGEIRWAQNFDGMPRNKTRVMEATWIDDRLYLIFRYGHRGGSWDGVITLRGKDGLVIGTERLLAKVESGNGGFEVALGDQFFVVEKGRILHRVAIRDGMLHPNGMLELPDVKTDRHHGSIQASVRGGLLLVHQWSRFDQAPWWAVEPDTMRLLVHQRRPDAWGVVNRTLFWLKHAGEDAPPRLAGRSSDGEALVHDIEPPGDGRILPDRIAMAMWSGPTLMTVGRSKVQPSGIDATALHVWNIEESSHASAFVLAETGAAERAAWLGDHLVIQMPDTVIVFDTAAAPGSVSRPSVRPHAIDEAIQTDGDLRDWRDLEATGSRDGIAWTLAEDDKALFIAVAVSASSARPARGDAYRGGGDWLRLAVRHRGGIAHWRIGVDSGGRTVMEPLPGHVTVDAPPIGIAVAHDLVNGQLVYELSLPIEDVRDGQSGDIHMAMSIYREQPARRANPTHIRLAGPAALRGATAAKVGYLRVQALEAR